MQDKLLNTFLESIDDMLKNYSSLFDEEELRLILSYKLKIEAMIGNNPNIIDIRTVENDLRRYIYYVWDYELHNGCHLISWLKDDTYKQKDLVFCNLVRRDDFESFCNCELGVEYEIMDNAIIGASNKDGATLIENKSRESYFTIGRIGDKVINSYNRITPSITPTLVLDTKDNPYHTVYNEVLLDGKYIIPKSIIYTDDEYKDVASNLATKLGIPVKWFSYENVK